MSITYNSDILLQYPMYVYSTHVTVMYTYVYMSLILLGARFSFAMAYLSQSM